MVLNSERQLTKGRTLALLSGWYSIITFYVPNTCSWEMKFQPPKLADNRNYLNWGSKSFSSLAFENQYFFFVILTWADLIDRRLLWWINNMYRCEENLYYNHNGTKFKIPNSWKSDVNLGRNIFLVSDAQKSYREDFTVRG